MAKPFHALKNKMKPERRAAAEERAKKILAEMPLQELRQARSLTQETLAKNLSVKQAAVSKMENRTDMYISTLRNMIKAMGGDLEIVAKFPDGDVKINQFKEINSDEDSLEPA
jgi:transcriptional regulator with XRE-family HTH domain